jgi:DNA-binding MarR family transcriptional regulator
MPEPTAFRAFIDAVGIHGQAAAAAAGLSPSDWYALSLLDRSGRLTATELSRKTGLTSGSVTRLIDRLERAGRVRRIADGEDRRRVIVEASPTAFAEGEIDELVNPARALVAEVLSRYTPDEQAVLFRFFAEAAPAFHEASDQLRKSREPGRRRSTSQ